MAAVPGQDHLPGPEADGPAPPLGQLHPEDGGQLPASLLRAGAAGGLSAGISPLLPPAGAAGGRDGLPAAGDRHGPAHGGAGGPAALRSASLRPGPGGPGGRHGASGGGAADGLPAPGHRHPGRHSPRPAGRGLRRGAYPLAAAGPAGGGDGGPGPGGGAGRGHGLRDLSGEPEDRHPLDRQGGEHPPADRLRPHRRRPASPHRHPPDQSGEGQRPGDGAPRRRQRPAGHRPPAQRRGAQRGGGGAGPGPGDWTAGVFQVHPRVSGLLLPVAAPLPAGGDAGGAGGLPLLHQQPGGGRGPGHGGRDVRGVRHLPRPVPGAGRGLPWPPGASAGDAHAGPCGHSRRGAPGGHVCAGPPPVRLQAAGGPREEAGLPSDHEEDRLPHRGGPGGGADLLLPGGHAGADLPLYHGPGDSPRRILPPAPPARGLLPRHLRPLHPLPQGHCPGHPGSGVRGAAGH